MTRAYSTDLRERVVAAVRAGSTARAAAGRFGVAVSSVVKWSQLAVRTGGGVVSGRTGGHRKPILAPHHDWLTARVETCAEVTVAFARRVSGQRRKGLARYRLALFARGWPQLQKKRAGQ